MPKPLKYALAAFGGLLVLLVIAVAIIAATFNPNDYKPLIIKLVQEKKQRTLDIPGDLELSLFPRIGADLGRVSLSEHQGKETFAAVERASVSVAFWPLLGRKVIVDRIRVEGLSANLKRYKDGKTNIDDLLSKEEQKPEQIAVELDGVTVLGSKIAFDDQLAGRKVEMAIRKLETGKIAPKAASSIKLEGTVKADNPALDLALDLDTGLALDLDAKRFAVKGLALKAKGAALGLTGLDATVQGGADLDLAKALFAFDGIDVKALARREKQTIEVTLDAPQLKTGGGGVTGAKVQADVKLAEGGSETRATLALPSFEGSRAAFKVPALTLDADFRQGETQARAKLTGALSGDLDKLLFNSPQLALNLDGKAGATAIKGTVTSALAVDLKTQVIELARLAADLSLPNPAGGALAFRGSGGATVNLGKKNLAANLSGKLDQSTINAKFGLARFSPPAYTFDVSIDQIDADRYLAKPPAPAKAAPGAAEKPIELGALKTLEANGTLRVGSLKLANVKASNLRLDIKAGGGKLEVSPLAASLYQGSTTGAVSLAATQPPRFAVKQTLSGIAIGPLLKDAIDKDPVEGRGNVALDLTTQGASVAALKKALAGSARLELNDGAVRGFNLAQAVRNAGAAIGAARGKPVSGTGSAGEKTDFSQLSASFRITGGVAHNDDLAAKSPLIRVGGAGDIDLGAERLDYTVKATVVNTLQGQGGPELQALRGVTVPVKLAGPFTAIGYSVDVAGMAEAAARAKVDEKKEELKAKAQEKLQDQLKGLFGK